jgi:glycosyltransferase involved in cell wall biosynthesis
MRTVSGPLVDIGIASWHRPQYLAQAVESVLGQTLDSWRLFVSEDGPSGGPVESRLAAYASDSRVWFEARGERVGAARNKTVLIQMGDAPYVALLDDDNVWEPEFLERRVAFLQSHPDCGFVFSSMASIDSSGQRIGRWPAPLAAGVQMHDEFIRRLLRANVVGASSALVRRAAYEDVGPAFDATLPRTYDYEMWLRLAVRFPAGYLPVCDVAGRIHDTQGSADLNGLVDEYSRLVDRLFEIVSDERPDLHPTGRQRDRKLASMMLSGALNALERGDRSVALQCMAHALRARPASLVDGRMIASGVGVVFGSSGRRAAAATRRLAHQHGLRLRA